MSPQIFSMRVIKTLIRCPKPPYESPENNITSAHRGNNNG
uniref:Uncharacterized protein n=1 Tax=Anguilla anguilla TaxID=7936 RepID=A0A0E9PQV9_ANGAN